MHAGVLSVSAVGSFWQIQCVVHLVEKNSFRRREPEDASSHRTVAWQADYSKPTDCSSQLVFG